MESEGRLCSPDPDIAGIGVVFSFVCAAVLTTLCSILAAVIDAAILDEMSIFPPAIENRLNDRVTPSNILRLLRWREVLNRLVLSLADQQLLTGCGLLIAGAIYTRKQLPDGTMAIYEIHFTFIVWLACLASSSHLASLMTLRRHMKRHPAVAYARIACVVIFAVGLLLCFVSSNAWTIFSAAIARVDFKNLLSPVYSTIRPTTWKVLFGVGFTYTFYLAIVQLDDKARAKVARNVQRCVRKLPLYSGSMHGTPLLPEGYIEETRESFKLVFIARKALGKAFWLLVVGSPLQVFVLQILFAAASLSAVVYMKYTSTDENGCGLNDPEENQWDFGQNLPVLLLILPFVSAFEFYHERRRTESLEYWTYRTNDIFPSHLPVTPASRDQTQAGLLDRMGALGIDSKEPRQRLPPDIGGTDIGEVRLAGLCRPVTR